MKNFFDRLFRRRSRGSSRRNGNSKIPFRLNFIFAIVGILFAVLVFRLAYMQIFQGSVYKSDVNQSDNSVKYGNVPRGMIYDSTGKVLVGNKTHRAITYTKGLSVMPQEIYNNANKLGSYITIPTKTLTKKQIGEYYLADKTNLAKATKVVPNGEKLAPQAAYDKALDMIQDGKLIKVTPQMKNAAAIFTEMSGAYQLSTTNIKTDGVSNKEIAEVGEHAAEMPGVQVGTSWSRDYPSGNEIQSIVGNMSSSKTGLPSDRVNELLAEGYSRNDSVGQSNLEQQYEPVLRGSKSQTEVKVGGDNKIVKEVKKYPGQRGQNLQLSINSKFQNKLQDLVKGSESGGVGNSTGAYAVVMNPKNGAVIGMAGVNRDPKTGKITPNELGTINSAIVMGSVVKGAMVSGALMDKVITPNSSTMEDMPIDIGGSKKSSWFNKNGEANMSVNAQGALEVSSNSYMMQLAMKEGGFKYKAGGSLNMSPNVFNTERNYFNQFGLGVKTGIDLPGETAGIQGPSTFANIGKALDESFGNYDSYTTIQLAQYMSTIANGGYRMKPHVVQNVRSTNTKNGQLGAVQNTTMPTVLNEIPMTPAERNVVTQGLYQVVHGTNKYKTGGDLSSISPEVSAKTGTAQTFYEGKPTVTLSLASYAPSKDPQVVVALAIPNLPVNAENNNLNLAKQIYQAYWSDVQNKP
ncbi:penicillin-binding protein transpeptidase [Fructilactobacillus fructivorans]|uniref:peptidoglycan D,D-transpeptidase FtsI family protein n=1 Tax=Fructilactobacillus fructivorans TaxID=1614 RepID=UPI000705269E|nr:penicillin-binding protein 2 [Fructilactobacillus fructivorans]KRN13416.1 penicillin-binding protein transpeptidase [Fructilactobacillus fructivorans]